MANSLGAGDDLGALRAWLKSYEESPATHRAYGKEVERFYLWCLHERRKRAFEIGRRHVRQFADARALGLNSRAQAARSSICKIGHFDYPTATSALGECTKALGTRKSA
jgi:hypothetical protein